MLETARASRATKIDHGGARHDAGNRQV
jgi:hypothetical protein